MKQKTSALQKLIDNRHALIPGAAHTYSKGDDQFPANAPAAILRGKGAYVWGSDGKKYLDWCMGLRSVSLGHVRDEVNAAVREQMKEGTNFGRPHPIEYAFADRLISLIPHIDMVKFGKNGSTVNTAATKLARAYTGRKLIVSCADHAFFSYDDWFIGTTAADAGIPQEIKNLTKTFRYNDLASLENLFKEYPDDIACVIMEVVTTVEPAPGFLKGVEKLCKKYGAVLILDEMITGFRWGLKGAAAYYGIKPDLVTYGKGIANGYSLSVLAGKRKIMDIGGIKGNKPRVFLISTTHGAETISLAAALATIEVMEKEKVADKFWKQGNILKKGLEAAIQRHALKGMISVIGFAPNLGMTFTDADGKASPVLRTLFLQEVTKRGILFQGYFAISASHGDREIKHTIQVWDEALKEMRRMIDSGKPEKFLKGPVVKPVFRKFN
jgi:glutamate-1-semialdehyde 2,1-aminomutase